MLTYNQTLEINTLQTGMDVMAEESEHTLIRRCQKGDHSAFNELFRRYRNRAYAFAYRYVTNPADAEEVVQGAFIRAFKYIHRFDAKYPSFYPWLRTIVFNEAQTYMGKKGRHRTEPLDKSYDGEEGPSDTRPDLALVGADVLVARKELNQVIREAVSELPEQQKACFTMFELENMKVKEIADVLGCTEGTVKTHLHRARYSLRLALKDVLKEY